MSNTVGGNPLFTTINSLAKILLHKINKIINFQNNSGRPKQTGGHKLAISDKPHLWELTFVAASRQFGTDRTKTYVPLVLQRTATVKIVDTRPAAFSQNLCGTSAKRKQTNVLCLSAVRCTGCLCDVSKGAPTWGGRKFTELFLGRSGQESK
jgi:hypothetical protein